MADSSDQSDCSSDRIPPDEVLADVQAERHQTLWGVVHGGLCATVIENVAPAGAVADRAAPRTHCSGGEQSDGLLGATQGRFVSTCEELRSNTVAPSSCGLCKSETTMASW